MRQFFAKNRADLIALLFITVTVAVFFAPVWLDGGWLPYGGGDLVSFLWPTYTFAARMIPGDLPLWNPYQYGGAPFWADNQSGVLYPPNLLLFLLTDAPPYQALEVLVMLHIWGAGIAMYAMLRLIRREQRFSPAAALTGSGPTAALTGSGPTAALTGAIIYMLSDVFITHQGNLNLIAVAAWLPLVFLGTWNALAKTLLAEETTGAFNRWRVLAGVAFGVGTLAGHAQMTYFTLLVIGAAGLWWIGAGLLNGQTMRSRLNNALSVIGTLAVIGVIAFGISAAALLPTLEMTGYTARAELTYAEAARYSLPPQALGGLFDPRLFGRGPAYFTGSWDRVEVGYIGVVGFLLALAGALTGIFRRTDGNRRDTLAIFLMLGAVAAFLLALGQNCMLHRLLYAILPGMRSIRVPARFVLLMNFAQAGLAAVAIQTLTNHTPRRHSANQIEGIDSPSLPAGRGPEDGVDRQHQRPMTRRPIIQFTRWQALASLLTALVALELILAGSGIEVQANDPRVGYDHQAAVEWLQTQPDPPFRIEGATPRWQPDSAALYGGQLFDSYGISNPLTLAAYDAIYWSVGQRGSPLYNALGVKYVIAGDEPPGDESFVPVYAAESGVTVYLNTNAQPLAYLVYDAVSVETPEEAWEAIHTPTWNAGQTVYVEGGPALDSEAPAGANLFFTKYDPNALAVVVNTPQPGYLVLSEVWYPGWRATIDGQPAPVYRTNTAFRAVYIPEPGEHTVLLTFRPLTVIIGLGITIITVIGLSARGLALWWQHKNQQ